MINPKANKKIIIYFLTIFYFLSSVLGINVGVYIEHSDDKKEVHCLDVNQNDDAYVTLSKIKDIEFSEIENQHILCSVDNRDINFICDPDSGRGWRMILQDNGQWHNEDVASYDAGDECYDTDFNAMANFFYYSFVTHTFSNIHYCAKQGNVIGLINEEKPSMQPGPPSFTSTPTFSQICEPLQISDIKAYVNNEKRGGIDEDGGRIKNVYPGSNLEIKIKVKNSGLTDPEKEIEDINVVGTLEDIKNGDDLDDSTKSFDLRPEKYKTVTLSFDIPESAEENDYDLLLELEGEDNDNFKYSKTLELEVEVEKDKHDIEIEKFELKNTRICNEEKLGIDIKIQNKGSNDESINLIIYSKELFLNIIEDIKLDEDIKSASNIFERSYSYKIPKQLEEGDYPISLSISYGDDEFIEKSINLKVKDCSNKINQKTKIKSSDTYSTNSSITNALPIQGNVVLQQIKTEKLNLNKKILLFSQFFIIFILILSILILFIKLLK